MTAIVTTARTTPKSANAVGVPVATSGTVPRSLGLSRAALAAHVGCDRPEQRCRCLICAVGAAKALDRSIGSPAWLEQEVYTPGLVSGGKISMVAAPGAAGIREHEDTLVSVHERLSLGKVGALSARLQLLAPVRSDDEPLSAAGDFSDLVGAKAFDDRIERGGDRRQRAELLDHALARGER